MLKQLFKNKKLFIMKKLLITMMLMLLTIQYSLAQTIHINPSNSLGGNQLHNTGQFYGNQPLANINLIESGNMIRSYNFMETKQMVIDYKALSQGNPTNAGITYNNSLIFGPGSGEGISSKRNSGAGIWGLDFFSNFKNRMHIANDGAIGVNTTNGLSPTTPVAFSKFHINNNLNNEVKNTTLYASSQFNGASNRVGIGNLVNQTGSFTNADAVNQFWSDYAWRYGTPTVYPYNSIGIANNLKNYTAPSLNNNPAIFSYTYGIYNDLDDKKIAGYNITLPGQPFPFKIYQPRVGILSVTNTQNGGSSDFSYGSGKIAAWLVNEGGSTPPPNNERPVIDGWGLWVDGRTFLRTGVYSPSDEKLKSNIRNLSDADLIRKISLLNPITYEYIESKGTTEIGFLAQEFGKVWPEAIAKCVNPASKEELIGINQFAVANIALATAKAQQKQIEELKSRINELSELVKQIQKK